MLAIIEESTVSDCLTGLAYGRKDEVCETLLIVLRISSSSVLPEKNINTQWQKEKTLSRITLEGQAVLDKWSSIATAKLEE